MKRLIAGFLSVCVAVSLLMTGCSSGGTDNTAQTDGPVTITIWHDKEDEVAQALQTELDTLAPDIVVKLEKKDGLTDSLKMVGNDRILPLICISLPTIKLAFTLKWAFSHR